jgi:AcrR family transcriptional regulator
MGRLDKKIEFVGAGFVPNARSRDRQLAIIRAAIGVLNERGFENASFEAVGKACRMRRSHVAYYFKSKADLFETVYRFVAQTAQSIVVDEVARCESPREKILGVIRGNFRWAEQHPEQVLMMMLFYFHSIRDQRFREVHRSIRDIGSDRLQAVIRQGLPLTPLKAGRFAKAVQALITGDIIDYYSTGKAGPLSKVCAATCESVEAIWKSHATNSKRGR